MAYIYTLFFNLFFTITIAPQMESPRLALLLFLLFTLLSFAFAAPRSFKAVGDEEDQCVYTVYIRTGSVWKGGTDSVISLALAGSDGYGVLIRDLVSWGGLMGPDYDYYERGNLDIFSGRGPCMADRPCWMNLTSDGSGSNHGWYCNYVEVTTTGPHMGCNQQQFTVEQWLATDAGPKELFAVRDNCSDSGVDEKLLRRRMGRRSAVAAAKQMM